MIPRPLATLLPEHAATNHHDGVTRASWCDDWGTAWGLTSRLAPDGLRVDVTADASGVTHTRLVGVYALDVSIADHLPRDAGVAVAALRRAIRAARRVA